MKFANIERLADNFVNETYMAEDEPITEVEGEEDLDLGADEPPVDDAPDIGAEEAPSEELPPEAVDALEQAVEQGVDAMLAALAPFGVEGEASVEGGDELPPEPMDGPEGDLELPGEEEEVAGVDVIDEDEVVNETLKRVTRRLKGMRNAHARSAKQEALVENIAARIAKRLNIK